MPRYIIRLHDDQDGQDYLLEWSTIVDAPITYGLSWEEFQEHYREEYGRRSFEMELPERMARVDATGTSSRLHDSVDAVISFNHAGPNETCLSKEQIIERYCRNREQTQVQEEHEQWVEAGMPGLLPPGSMN